MEITMLSFFREKVKQYQDSPALHSKDKNKKFKTVTFNELFTMINQFGAGLISVNVKRGEHVGVISDNRKEWIISNLGILGLGALDIPRGSDSSADEIKYILRHAECPICIVENAEQFTKVLSIKKDLPLLKTFIILDEDFKNPSKKEKGIDVFTFKEIIDKGKALLEKDQDSFVREIDKGKGDDLATIIYTSGTTGQPKGVMLTHNNFLHQIRTTVAYLDMGKGDIFLSVLPIWHAFERAVEYVALFTGGSLVYSKLIGKVMLEDMETMKPTIFPSVPRIWESVRSGIYKNVNAGSAIQKVFFNLFINIGTIYVFFQNMLYGWLPQFKKRNRIIDILISFFPFIIFTPLKLLGNLLVFGKIKKKLGGNFKFGVSGAGALPPHVDKFFAATGILLLEGYGLTEAAPVVAVRKQHTPVANTIGPVLPEIISKICDPEGKELPPGEKGVLFIKGPNVMKGYYKEPEETRKILSDDGWLNTGDLAMSTIHGELKILGREKETIVLLGGENIEPGPIEDTILQSEYIEQVMVVGQDKKYLGALVLPHFENCALYAKQNNLPFTKPEDLINSPEIGLFLKKEIDSKVNIKQGFKAFERIFKFTLIDQPFEVGKELTPTLKLKRNIITDLYKKKIDQLYD